MTILRRLSTAAAIVVLIGFMALERTAAQSAAPPTGTCATDSAFHVLDFWLGAWSVVDSAGRPLGTNRIERILGGCAITESWNEAGSEGRSLFYYVPSQRTWKQVWVTPQALELGGVKEKHLIAHSPGTVRFQGELIGPRGALLLDRTTLTRLSDGRVRQVIEISRDSGATWRLNFDGIYVAAAQGARAAGDTAIARGDWNTLISVYEPLVEREHDNGMPWFRLGAGLQEVGRLSDAVSAYREALRVGFQPGQAELRLARVFARLHADDSAIVHIENATKAGVVVELLTSEADFDALRPRPRYAALVDSLETARYPCRRMPETRQFDFWLGDWEVTPWGSTATVSLGRPAINRVTMELEHCVIHEHWTSSTGAKGESINFWDPNRRAWRQIWMDTHQWSLDYEGQYRDGAMRFDGWSLGPDGSRRLEKLSFFNVAPDTVRQLFQQSTDGGKTWNVTFDGRYVRLKSTSASSKR